ncbi:hypothetical protein L5515_010361 [Caenorhabditis briggsae]|uniref:Uncharacterized protein n=1 Tax=Caenorhabditis briggsae TaxID=6238 RepID=A0AAE9ER02_CAEBR|nr:hypothetical protein L5515_010361 [Caenorhabditis briggsae]
MKLLFLLLCFIISSLAIASVPSDLHIVKSKTFEFSDVRKLLEWDFDLRDIASYAKQNQEIIKMEVNSNQPITFQMLLCSDHVMGKVVPFKKTAVYLDGPWLEMFAKEIKCSDGSEEHRWVPKPLDIYGRLPFHQSPSAITFLSTAPSTIPISFSKCGMDGLMFELTREVPLVVDDFLLSHFELMAFLYCTQNDYQFVCVSSQEPDDDFFSYLKFPNVRNISERFQTNATGFDILEDIQWREEPMDLSDDSANHRHPKNLKNSKSTEQMNIVVSIVITVLLILLLVIVVVLGPCVLLIIVLVLAGLAFYAIRKILKYLEDRRFRAPNRASVGFEMKEF